LSRAFASRLAAVPMLILAVTDTGAGSASMFFDSEQSQALLTRANEFADSCHASFITTCTNFEQQCMYCDVYCATVLFFEQDNVQMNTEFV